MNARVLEAKRLLLGEENLEVWLEEREDGRWILRLGPGVAERLHFNARTDDGDASVSPSVSEMLYKAELFDHMVGHIQDQMERTGDGDGEGDSKSRLSTYAKVGVCTDGLSDEALEAMAREFMSQNYTQATLDEIAAWARDVLAIRHERVEPIVATPDLLQY